MPLRCLIVDDNAAFLEASRATLEGEGITVVGVATSAAEAVQASEELELDVILVDIRLGDESGFELTRRLADAAGPARVILISTDPEEDLSDLIAESPALGFIAKPDLSAGAIQDLLRDPS